MEGKESVLIVDSVYWISVPIVISSLMTTKLTRKTCVKHVDKNSHRKMANLKERKGSKSRRMVHFAKSVDAADESVKHVLNAIRSMIPTKTPQRSRKIQNRKIQKIQTHKMQTPRKVAKRHQKIRAVQNQVAVEEVRDDEQTLIEDIA